MTTKKAAKVRAPRKEPPLAEREILFCHLVMKGNGSTKANQTDRINEAGKKVGYTAAEAQKVYHRKPVLKYLDAYRERLMIEMVKEDVRQMRRKGFTREDVLGRLWELGNIPVEKGVMTGQIAAMAEMGKIMGLVVAPRNPDEFFKGRSEEEIAHFAEHGSFAPPRVN